MLSLLPIIPIIGTTMFMVAVATIWYSDLFTGKIYREIVSLSNESAAIQRNLLVPNLILTVFSYGLVLSLSTVAMLILAKANLSIYFAPVSILAVSLVTVLQNILWEGRPWRYFLIVGGFYTLLILGGSAMIWYWPW